MEEIKYYFKIYFDEGGSNNMRYYIEESHVSSYLEYIPLLAQGYIRCLSCLKKTFGRDKESSELLLGIVRRILLLCSKNISLIKSCYGADPNFNILKFLMDKDTETMGMGQGAFLYKIFSSFLETKNKDEITANINVKYEIEMYPKGRVVMYDTSHRINNFIQIQSYVIMLVHLLPRLKFIPFMFFMNYMVEIDNEIEKNNYTSLSGMTNIIKNSSNNFRKIVNVWMEQDADNNMNMDRGSLLMCLPEL